MKSINFGKKVVILVLGIFPAALLGALSPYYQSTKEITMILTHPDVVANLRQGSIDSISKQDNVYTLQTADCRIVVAVLYQPKKPHWVGPVSFDLKILEKSCSHTAVEK